MHNTKKNLKIVLDVVIVIIKREVFICKNTEIVVDCSDQITGSTTKCHCWVYLEHEIYGILLTYISRPPRRNGCHLLLGPQDRITKEEPLTSTAPHTIPNSHKKFSSSTILPLERPVLDEIGRTYSPVYHRLAPASAAEP